MIRILRATALALTLATAPPAQADSGIDCVAAQCEGPGRTCVTELYTIYDACMAAGNKACNAAPAAAKMDCLKRELMPCVSTRNKSEDACLATMRTCYKACGPFDGKRLDYWCVAEVGKRREATFCPVNPPKPENLYQCEDRFKSFGEQLGTMTCETL